MGFYSKGHYRSVSPKEDTPAQTAVKIADEKERQIIHKEALALYPTIEDHFKYVDYVDSECWNRIFSKRKV